MCSNSSVVARARRRGSIADGRPSLPADGASSRLPPVSPRWWVGRIFTPPDAPAKDFSAPRPSTAARPAAPIRGRSRASTPRRRSRGRGSWIVARARARATRAILPSRALARSTRASAWAPSTTRVFSLDARTQRAFAVVAVSSRSRRRVARRFDVCRPFLRSRASTLTRSPPSTISARAGAGAGRGPAVVGRSSDGVAGQPSRPAPGGAAAPARRRIAAAALKRALRLSVPPSRSWIASLADQRVQVHEADRGTSPCPAGPGSPPGNMAERREATAGTRVIW